MVQYVQLRTIQLLSPELWIRIFMRMMGMWAFCMYFARSVYRALIPEQIKERSSKWCSNISGWRI